MQREWGVSLFRKRIIIIYDHLPFFEKIALILRQFLNFQIIKITNKKKLAKKISSAIQYIILPHSFVYELLKTNLKNINNLSFRLKSKIKRILFYPKSKFKIEGVTDIQISKIFWKCYEEKKHFKSNLIENISFLHQNNISDADSFIAYLKTKFTLNNESELSNLFKKYKILKNILIVLSFNK